MNSLVVSNFKWALIGLWKFLMRFENTNSIENLSWHSCEMGLLPRVMTTPIGIDVCESIAVIAYKQGCVA